MFDDSMSQSEEMVAMQAMLMEQMKEYMKNGGCLDGLQNAGLSALMSNAQQLGMKKTADEGASVEYLDPSNLMLPGGLNFGKSKNRNVNAPFGGWIAPGPPPGHDIGKVMIRGINPECLEIDIVDMFGEDAQVVFCKVAKDDRGQSKEYAFVQFETPEIMTKMMQKYEQAVLMGYAISIDQVRSKDGKGEKGDKGKGKGFDKGYGKGKGFEKGDGKSGKGGDDWGKGRDSYGGSRDSFAGKGRDDWGKGGKDFGGKGFSSKGDDWGKGGGKGYGNDWGKGKGGMKGGDDWGKGGGKGYGGDDWGKGGGGFARGRSRSPYRDQGGW